MQCSHCHQSDSTGPRLRQWSVPRPGKLGLVHGLQENQFDRFRARVVGLQNNSLSPVAIAML